MKRLLLIVLPLLLIVGCSKSVDETTLIEKNGVMYLPNSDKPYTGEVFTNYSTGEKEYQGTYEKGLLVSYSYLNKDGSVKEPINYETTLIERDGVFYTKDTNKPYSGQVFSLNDVGKKKEEGILKDGKMISKTEWEWYNNGQKESEETFKDGKRDGLGTWWYENGQKKDEFTWKDGKVDGTWKWYRSNGTKMKEGNWKDSKLDGLCIEWYENGRKKIKGINKDGRRDGLWTWWYENGQKKEEVTFKDGEMISGKKWNKDGSVKE